MLKQGFPFEGSGTSVYHVRTCLILRQHINQFVTKKNIFYLLSWEDRSIEAEDRDGTWAVGYSDVS